MATASDRPVPARVPRDHHREQYSQDYPLSSSCDVTLAAISTPSLKPVSRQDHCPPSSGGASESTEGLVKLVKFPNTQKPLVLVGRAIHHLVKEYFDLQNCLGRLVCSGDEWCRERGRLGNPG
jgi:hypothetical protein